VGLLYDLGLNWTDYRNPIAVESKIKELDANFHLVMIMERFEESLILMQDMLCWNLEDMTFVMQHNKKSGAKKSRRKYPNLNVEQHQKLATFLEPDYRLYNFFKEKLEKKLQAYNKHELKRRVFELKQANRKLHQKCKNLKLRTTEGLYCRLVTEGEEVVLTLASVSQDKRAKEALNLKGAEGDPREERKMLRLLDKSTKKRVPKVVSIRSLVQ